VAVKKTTVNVTSMENYVVPIVAALIAIIFKNNMKQTKKNVMEKQNATAERHNVLTSTAIALLME